MTVVGTIEYKAKVTGASEAKQSADDVGESYAEMGEQAESTAGAAGFLGGALSTVAVDTDDAAEAADDADAQFTLLKGTVESLRGGIGALLGTAGASGIGGVLSGAVGLGSLVRGATFGSLVKGMATLGGLIIAADTITDIIEGKAPLTAFVDSVEDFGELVLNPIGIDNDLVESVFGIGTFILTTMSIASFITGVSISTMIGAAGTSIAGYFGYASIGALVKGGAATIATFLGGISLTGLVIGVGSILALIGGLASLGDLVDGDISSWNLPGKFGAALGEAFREEWPGLADRIDSAFRNNPIYTAGQTTGNLIFGGQAGARIQSDGIMQVHSGEELVPADVTRDLEMVDNLMGMGDGGGGTNNVTQVDTVNVDLSGDFDPSNVSRRELDSLADRLVDLIGDKTNRRAGVR